jgi:hypothetical protein
LVNLAVSPSALEARGQLDAAQVARGFHKGASTSSRVR